MLRYAVGGTFQMCTAFPGCVGRVRLKPFLFQIAHLHHLRAFVNQPVRADQEEQVPGLLPAAGAQVRALLAAVPGHLVQKQNNPL